MRKLENLQRRHQVYSELLAQNNDAWFFARRYDLPYFLEVPRSIHSRHSSDFTLVNQKEYANTIISSQDQQIAAPNESSPARKACEKLIVQSPSYTCVRQHDITKSVTSESSCDEHNSIAHKCTSLVQRQKDVFLSRDGVMWRRHQLRGSIKLITSLELLAQPFA